MSYSNLCIFIIGGLSIFLFGLNLMRSSLTSLSSNKLKNIIHKTTSSNLKAFITGIIATILIQSSSGITAITVALTSANLVSLSSAIAIMLGSNIGTTATAFLFTIRIEEYSLLIVALGSFLYFFDNIKEVASTIIGLGLLFFGLYMMNISFKEVSTSKTFINAIYFISANPLKGILGGSIVTALIQSSSATIAILQNLYTNNSVSLITGIAIMLGANIGTTIPSLVMAISSSKEAKLAVYINIIVNMIGAIIFLIILKPFSDILLQIEKHTILKNNKSISIAISHMFFNIVSSVILFFYIDKVVNLFSKPLKKRGYNSIISNS